MSVKTPISRSINEAIRKTPGVAGGAACVAKTRIPVWGLVSFRRQGTTDSELHAFYPGLTPEDLEAAWEYARLNTREIDRAISRNERD